MVTSRRGLAAIATLLAASTLTLRSQPADPPTIRVGIFSGPSTRPSEGPGSLRGGFVVRSMPLEEYVAGVVAGEAFPNSGAAALEALAITVRTYAVANRGRHRADGFDLCDQTHCQALRKPTAATSLAATATAGRILTDRGGAAEVFYSAACGGHTERPSEVWPGAVDPPFLPARRDEADEGEPAWDADLDASDLGRALRAAGYRGELRDLIVVARNESARVSRLRLAGLTPSEISGADFRLVVARTLGPLLIKSAAFEVRRTAQGFHFSGHGFGHGVGLCVLGSLRLAARGESAEDILGLYFRGLTVSPLSAPARSPTPSAAPSATRSPTPSPARSPTPSAAPSATRSPTPSAAPSPTRSPTPSAAPSGITVLLPESERGERERLGEAAASARDRLAGELGVMRPAQLSLRFHPTLESYEHATGRAWFTSGATIGSELHFPPLPVLRERGILDRAIRHELVHALIDPALTGRPMWVREGAALYFSRDSTQPERPAGRVQCPSDRELQQPSSPGELSIAYGRAAACFDNRLGSGRSWRQIER